MKLDLEEIQTRIDSQKQIQSETQPSARIFNDDERKLVSWFFAAVRTQWGAGKFNSQFGEGEDVQFAKRHWAPRILKHSPDELKEMLHMADSERLAGNDKFTWPDPAMILSLVATSWERQCHKVYQTSQLLENKTAKESRAAEGLDAIRKLRQETGL